MNYFKTNTDFLSDKFIGKLKNYITNNYVDLKKNSKIPFFTFYEKLLKTEDTKKFLENLQIFKNIKVTEKSIEVENKKKIISIKTSLNKEGISEKSLSLNFPNLFKNGECLNLNIFRNKNVEFKFIKPIINHKLDFLELCTFSENKKIPNTQKTVRGIFSRYISDNFSFSFIHEYIDNKTMNYLSLKSSCNKMGKLAYDFGFFKDKKFSKIVFEKKNIVQNDLIFLKSSFNLGLITGSLYYPYRFFLGKNTRGCKENSIYDCSENGTIGGKLFGEINSELGMKFKNLNLFCFKDLAYCSKSNSIKNFKKNFLESFSQNDHKNLGLIYGLGLRFNFMNISADLTYNNPLFDKKDCEKIQFGLNMEY